jgi:hypothetical protein
MTTHTDCTMSRDELLAWWLGELDAAADARLDAHVFACETCANRLTALLQLGDAIRRATLAGHFGFVVPRAFVGCMRAAGLTLREYTLQPGGSVNCTIAPGDDFVVSHLHVPLAGVTRLDVVLDDPAQGQFRLDDVPFDPNSDALTLVPSAALLRSFGVTQQRVRLIAVTDAQEHVLGEYTFNHTPSM